MEFSKNKTLLLICAFSMLTALAASGCGSSEIQNSVDDTPTQVSTDTESPTTGNKDPVVDPGPGNGGNGGVKPELADAANVDAELVDEPTNPPPPSGGGGGMDTPGQDKCNQDEPFSRRKINQDQASGTADEVLDSGNCIMI